MAQRPGNQRESAGISSWLWFAKRQQMATLRLVGCINSIVPAGTGVLGA